MQIFIVIIVLPLFEGCSGKSDFSAIYMGVGGAGIKAETIIYSYTSMIAYLAWPGDSIENRKVIVLRVI